MTHDAKDILMARGFARVDNGGNLVSSKGVVGMTRCTRNGDPINYGAYCFNLEFTPLAVVANSIPHPDDNLFTPFGPILYTAGPNLNGVLTTDGIGPVKCPPGFQDAAVICYLTGHKLSMAYGGFFALFE
ncbi:hypothetical protein [Streptomyces venezuelae]|uniref:hypothetical protein n=1 Tax=Streptomyces venezuelae TaxID=54571 RepID=UPI00332D9077